MSRISGIKIIARVAMVGIAALGSLTGSQPLGEGWCSQVIGTHKDYPTYTYVAPHMLWENQGRLVDELKVLWRANKIHIELDGRRILAITELAAYGEPTGYPRRMSDFMAPGIGSIPASGTWASSYDSGNKRRMVRRTAADASDILLLEIPPSLYTRDGNGGIKLLGVEIVYRVSTAALVDVQAGVYKSVKPDTGSQIAAGAAYGTGSYDAAHDTAAERKAVGYHTLSYSFTESEVAWLAAGESLFVELVVDSTGIANAVFDYYGLNINYLVRPGIASDSLQS